MTQFKPWTGGTQTPEPLQDRSTQDPLDWDNIPELTEGERDTVLRTNARSIQSNGPPADMTPREYAYYTQGFTDCQDEINYDRENTRSEAHKAGKIGGKIEGDKEGFDRGEIQGYEICFDSEYAELIGDIKPLIDSVLSRTDIDTFDPIYVSAVQLNEKYQELLFTLDMGKTIVHDSDKYPTSLLGYGC